MNLITDRTLADVLLGTDKGRYGAGDLNRVEQAVEELYAIAKILGISETTRIKTDWAHCAEFSPDRWPTRSQMDRYLGNIHRLCEMVEAEMNLPCSMENLTWEAANRIEEALLAADTRIRKIIQALHFSGELFAGEENVL